MNEALEEQIRLLETPPAERRRSRIKTAAVAAVAVADLSEPADWSRIRYLAVLLEKRGYEREADDALAAAAQRGAGTVEAAKARNLHARLMVARGQPTAAEAELEDAYIAAAPIDAAFAATLANNLATLARRRGDRPAQKSWLARENDEPIGPPHFLPLYGAGSDAPTLHVRIVEAAHAAIDDKPLPEAEAAVEAVATVTEEVLATIGGDSVEAALATVSFAHISFRMAQRRGQLAKMAKAVGVLDTVCPVLGSRLGADDSRVLDAQIVTRECALEMAIVEGKTDRILAAGDALERLRERARRPDGWISPRELIIEANLCAEAVEIARLRQSVVELKEAVARLRGSVTAIVERFGATHPHAIAAQTNLGCAQLDLACQEHSEDALIVARRELGQAARSAEREYAAGHPARTVVEHQLALCRRIGSGVGEDDVEGPGGVGTKLRKLTVFLGMTEGGWNVSYSSFDRLGHNDDQMTSGGSGNLLPNSVSDAPPGAHSQEAGHGWRPGITIEDAVTAVRRMWHMDLGSWSSDDLDRVITQCGWQRRPQGAAFGWWVATPGDIDIAVEAAPADAPAEFYSIEMPMGPGHDAIRSEPSTLGTRFNDLRRILTVELGVPSARGGAEGPWIRWHSMQVVVELIMHHSVGVSVRFLAPDVLRQLELEKVASGTFSGWTTNTDRPEVASFEPSPIPVADEMDSLRANLAMVLRSLHGDWTLMDVSGSVRLGTSHLPQVTAAIDQDGLKVRLTAHWIRLSTEKARVLHQMGLTEVEDRRNAPIGAWESAAGIDASEAAAMMTKALRIAGSEFFPSLGYYAKLDDGARVYLPALGILELDPPS